MHMHLIIALAYGATIIGVVGYMMWLATRLVKAQQQSAQALAAIAARLDTDNRGTDSA